MKPTPFKSAFNQAISEAWSEGGGLVLPLAFFIGVGILVPFSVGVRPELLVEVSSGVLWIALVLVTFVTMERLYQADLEDGVLELWVQERQPLAEYVLAKTLAHWLVAGLPIAIVSPLLGLLLHMSFELLPFASLCYGVGSLAFFFWGGLGAALSASVRRGGLLIALVVLPLYVPTVLFGVLTIASYGTDQMVINLSFLVSTTIFTLALCPFMTSVALRMSAD